jgi:VWFA-related protein
MLTVTVTNARGELIGGLTRENFLVSHGKVQCQVKAVQHSDEPINVGFLADTSGSMDLFEFRDVARQRPIANTIKSFISLAHKRTEYFLVSFGSKPELRADWTRDVDLLTRAVPPKGTGRTALYDALIFAINKVVKGPHGRHVIILFSDGVDNFSGRQYDDVLNLLKESDVLLYSIGVRTDYAPRDQRNGADVLTDFTEVTGGTVLFPRDSKQMEFMANLIATELHHQYRLACDCGKTASANKWRRLKVRVRLPSDAVGKFNKLKIRTRQGYLAN